jgi:hypothetical protein
MVRFTVPLLLCLLTSSATADSDAIRRRRRSILEVDHEKASVADVLASLWETDGIQPNDRSLAKKGSKKSGKKGSKKGGKKGGDDMSFYYF